jgi:uncharacterized protein with ParB-like and HNH nuclease domain
MSRVYPQLRTVRELLSAKYALDFYQREYQWVEENIEELLNDFENSFSSNFDPSHERKQVAGYPHYFLGTIITVTEGAEKNIVDGQQRLTTLTLLLIYLHHALKDYPGSEEQRGILRQLILSMKHGTKSFNIDVPERNQCMQTLYETGFYDPSGQRDLSVLNLVARYTNIQEQFPEELLGDTLPYFADWMIDNVDLVEIETSTDDAAFTIFETMNDRGVNLGPADMLKGYLLGNINEADAAMEQERKSEANALWREQIFKLIQIDKDREADFFKDWLRAQYAETIRERKRGAKNRDFENINKFHRWVRDERKRIGLKRSGDFYDFVMNRFACFSQHYIHMLRAAANFTPELDYIYYNAHNNFTLQYALMLAPLRIEDDQDTVIRKMRLVSGFVDIFVARRIVNFRTLSYSSIQYTMFNLMKEIRDLDVHQLVVVLRQIVSEMEDSFESVSDFYLHSQNKQRIHHLLARMTAFIEQESGVETSFEKYVSREIRKPYEVEHIWAYKHERHMDEFPYKRDFEDYRNRFGGLILLPRGFNQSYGDLPYEDKLEHYYGQNLLAQSLHPRAYERNPGFRQFISRYDLGDYFRPYPQFKKADLDARQELYYWLCEIIWSPARFEWELR